MDRGVEMSSNDNSNGNKFPGLYDALFRIGLGSSHNDAHTRHLTDLFSEHPPAGHPQNLLSLSDLMGYGLRPPPIPPSTIGRLMLPPPPTPPNRNTSLKDDLLKEVESTFRAQWETRDGVVVPADNGVKLGNDGVRLEATILYADLDGSTNLVDTYKPQFAAEIYKTFLNCAARIIRSESGEIVAYDGDRIMAVFIGKVKNNSAARAALKINYAVENIIGPGIRTQYPNTSFQTKHVVGIDTSDLLIAKTGIRNANDLVWVGRCANYAAKLSSLPHEYRTYITEEVYNVLDPSLKYSNRQSMWECRSWTAMNRKTIYASNYWWTFD
jgi:class 3 adenylate cyclase